MFRKSLLAATLFAATTFAAPAAVANPYTVELNKASVITLPRPAASIIIGNPAIADVQVFSENQIIITGQMFGETNIMIFDANGQPILSTDINVTETQNGTTQLIYGTGLTKTYACSPYCRPAPTVGDEPEFFSTVLNSATELSAQQETAAVSAAAGPR